MPKEAKVQCETPTPGKKPTSIAKWKYDLIREAILKVTPQSSDGIVFKGLADRVAAQIAEEDLAKLGSVSWYTTTVKLDMEVKGEIERISGSNPQLLRRVI